MRGITRDTAMAQNHFNPELDIKLEGKAITPPAPAPIESERKARKVRTEPENDIEQGEMFS